MSTNAATTSTSPIQTQLSLAGNVLEHVTLGSANLDVAECQDGRAVDQAEEVRVLLPALDRGRARVRRARDLRV